MASELKKESELDSKQRSTKLIRQKRPYIDRKKLERLMYMNPIMQQVTYFFETTPDHIEEIIYRNYGLTFSEFRAKFRFELQKVLQDKALQRALHDNSDKMLELCLKNINGWSTNSVEQTSAPNVITLKYNLDEPPKIKDVTPSDPAD